MKEEQTTMVQISDLLRGYTIRIDASPSASRMRVYRRLLGIFSTAKDSRVAGRTTYHLGDLILMMFLSVLAGADSYRDMEEFWKIQSKLYRRIFYAYGRVPSHDCFRHVLGVTKPEELNRVLVSVLTSSESSLRKALKLPKREYRHVCVDGKQLRGTGRVLKEGVGEIRDLQSLNVYDNTSDICLYSSAIDTKTNEIPTAQEILRGMELKNCVVTFDAMNTQKETCVVVRDRKGDYVGGLKGNHGNLMSAVQCMFTQDVKDGLKAGGGDGYAVTREISHNQLEEREFHVLPLTPSQRKGFFSEWAGIRSVVCYVKTCTNNITGKVTSETRYYITSLKDTDWIAATIRGHWGVENRLHNGLDTVFMEDLLSDADRNAAMNRDALCKACLSVIRKYQDIKGYKGELSKRGLRKMMGWGFEQQLAEYVTLLDPKAIEECLIVNPKEKKGKA